MTMQSKEMDDKISKSLETYNWVNKLADYQQDYRCTDDCKQSGCPVHTATFSISHATDTYSIDWGDGDKIWLDNARMALLLQFAEKASDKIKNLLTLRTKEILEAVKLDKANDGYYKNIYPPQSRWKEGWDDAVADLEAKKTEILNRYLKEGKE